MYAYEYEWKYIVLMLLAAGAKCDSSSEVRILAFTFSFMCMLHYCGFKSEGRGDKVERGSGGGRYGESNVDGWSGNIILLLDVQGVRYIRYSQQEEEEIETKEEEKEVKKEEEKETPKHCWLRVCLTANGIPAERVESIQRI